MIRYKGINFEFKSHRQLKRYLLATFARRMGLHYAARRNYTIKRIWKFLKSEIVVTLPNDNAVLVPNKPTTAGK